MISISAGKWYCARYHLRPERLTGRTLSDLYAPYANSSADFSSACDADTIASTLLNQAYFLV